MMGRRCVLTQFYIEIYTYIYIMHTIYIIWREKRTTLLYHQNVCTYCTWFLCATQYNFWREFSNFTAYYISSSLSKSQECYMLFLLLLFYYNHPFNVTTMIMMFVVGLQVHLMNVAVHIYREKPKLCWICRRAKGKDCVIFSFIFVRDYLTHMRTWN